MTAILVIGSAVLGSTGLFMLWEWVCRRVVAREERQLTEDLQRGRW